MSLSEVKETTTKLGTLQCSLEEACSVANDRWFAPNQELLAKLRSGLEDGSYDLDIDFLFAEVKTDASLFLYCLKELSRMLRAEKKATTGSPLEIFHRAGLTKIKSVLNDETKIISAHNLREISPLQAERLKETMVAASATELLSEQYNIDGDIGYSAGLARQLGLTLIAWNYPEAYRLAMGSVQKGMEIDDAFTLHLGFSPHLLALAVIRKWDIDPVLRDTLETGAAASDEAGNGPINRLAQFCDIGEMLARANNPELYPTARGDWLSVRQALEQLLGHEGLKKIRLRIRENCESYVQSLPGAFRDVKTLDPEAKLKRHADEVVIDGNPWLKGCSPIMRKKLTDLYMRHRSGLPAKDALTLLIKEVIPLAGFGSGYIYTLDPIKNSLAPRVKIGNPELIGPDHVAYKTAAIAAHNPILTAFECSSPIIGDYSHETSTSSSYIVGGLGASNKIGVLYLEFPNLPLQSPGQNVLQHFKAVRQAINDFLGAR